jgi:hypothetical protein
MERLQRVLTRRDARCSDEADLRVPAEAIDKVVFVDKRSEVLFPRLPVCNRQARLLIGNRFTWASQRARHPKGWMFLRYRALAQRLSDRPATR